MEETQNAQLTFKQRTIKRILPTLFFSVMLPFILFVSLPFEIFGNNLDEFIFALKDFLPACLLLFLVATCIIFFALLFLPNKAYRIMCALVVAGSFLCFIQGTFLNAGYTSLGGDNMGAKSISTFSKIFNLFIWLLVIAGAVVLACLKDKNGIINIVAIIVGLVVLITHVMPPLVVAISNEGTFLTKEERLELNNDNKMPSILTTKNMTTLSSQENILFICVDRFDQTFANDSYAKHPEVFSELTGFTAFDDNISKYGHTFPAVSHMLTAKSHDLSNSRAEYLNGVYEDNKTLNVLEENGYDFNLYMPSFYGYEDADALPDTVTNKSTPLKYEVSNKIKLPLKMVQMAFYRCLPILLKPFVGTVDSTSANVLVSINTKDGAKLYETDMKNIWFDIKDETFNFNENKQFTYIHLEGCHNSIYDENWNITNIANRNDYFPSLKNSFVIINKYLAELKAKGLYEDATIIITGDHGNPYDDLDEVNQPRLTALFFKPSGVSTGELKHTSAQVSHDNIWATIFNSVGITPDSSLGKSLFEINEGESTVREFVWHTYTNPTDQYIYKIEGKGSDYANWIKTDYKQFPKFIME